MFGTDFGQAYAEEKKHSDYWVAVTDQASEQILVFDTKKTNLNAKSALKWSWAPTEENGFDEELISAWGTPSGVKLRKAEDGGKYMLVTDSEGLVAMVSYPNGKRVWGHNVGGNPHAAELLPDGNVAAASSHGHFVRVYTASQGPDSSNYTEYYLQGAHGVLWDPKREVLWALGDLYLVSLKVTGTPEAPKLEEISRSSLPTFGGHDLSPVYSDIDKLWVTTNTNVYQYSKSTNTWSENYEGASEISRKSVKSIGDQPSGQVVLAVPRAGTKYSWTTDTVDFYLPSDKRVLNGGSFYKARIWNPNYQ
ncbi:hypothetical protein WQ54_09160 [Bacillus sp. SA1-12]|nr:hypothetical protein WQ54_09160 [Bacillus sp. SA1-12]